MKFRKKPVVIEAIQWDGQIKTFETLLNFGAPVELNLDILPATLYVGTLEDGQTKNGQPQVRHVATVDDWIIKGVSNEYYPCKPDIFEQTYELVNET